MPHPTFNKFPCLHRHKSEWYRGQECKYYWGKATNTVYSTRCSHCTKRLPPAKITLNIWTPLK